MTTDFPSSRLRDIADGWFYDVITDRPLGGGVIYADLYAAADELDELREELADRLRQ